MTIKINTWNQIIKDLESRLTEAEYKTWLSNLSLDKYDNNIAFIKVPNKFIADWIEENYIDKIKKSFNKYLNKELEIKIIHNKNYTLTRSTDTSIDEKDTHSHIKLNSSMLFDNFVIGDCNIFAYSSALKIANRCSEYYSPLYIYSKSSLGKTHLLNAIGNNVLKKDPTYSMVSITADDYYSDFNHHLKINNLSKFKNKYYNIDLLLFDDIHILSNKKRLQEEFISLFDYLYEAKKQIVITSDRTPNRLNNFNSQVISRLGSGLIAEINNYTNNIKINIIKQKLKDENITLPNDIILLLSQSNNNIKILIKNLIRIKTFLSINNTDLNLSMVKSLINNNRKIGVKDIQSITAGYFNITVQELISYKKGKIYSYPRHVAIYLCRKKTALSYKELGNFFNGRDHSTLIYAYERIEKSRSQNKNIMNDINNLNRLLTVN